MTQRVFVDANVLASRTILDWLFFLRIENEGMFQLHATEDVLAETVRVLRRKHPRLPGAAITDRRHKIEKCLDEVIDNFSDSETFSGKDEGDYHVHAAAIAAQAQLLLTDNDPEDITSTPDNEPYEIITSDEFFMLVTDSNPQCVVPITKEQLSYWNSKPTGKPLDEALRRARCPEFAKRIREALQHIAVTQ